MAASTREHLWQTNDYGEKVKDAFDYEDIKEKYEESELYVNDDGDRFLPKQENVAVDVSLVSLSQKSSIFDDENYDEDEETVIENKGDRDTLDDAIHKKDYGVKTEYIDFEDMEKKYKCSDVQATDIDDVFLPKKENVVSLASLNQKSSIFDDENYDEDEETVLEKETGKDTSYYPIHQKGLEKSDLGNADVFSETYPIMELMGSAEGYKNKPILEHGHVDFDAATTLPILYVEDGMKILRFSEIFDVHRPLRKKEKKARQRHFSIKEHVPSSFSIEEDEENFLKSFQCDPLISRQLILSQGDVVQADEGGSENISSEINMKSKDFLSSGQPMKDCSDLDISDNTRICDMPKFYPLEHQNWEDKIIWGNSPTESDQSMDASVESESDGETFHVAKEACKPVFTVKKNSHAGLVTEGQKFISNPQMLRFKSKLVNGPFESAEFGNERFSGSFFQKFNKMSLQNKDLFEGSWLDHIIWDPDKPILKPKLILDLQDEHMLFETSEHKDLISNVGTLRSNNMHKLLTGDAHDHLAPINASVGRFNISNDKYYASKKSSQPLKAHAKKRSVYGLKIMHSVPALRLQTMKPRLSNKEIANFHRPKALWYPHDNKKVAKLQGDFSGQGSFKVILKTLAGKYILLRVGAQELVSSVIMKISKKLDFTASEKVSIMFNGKQLDENDSLTLQNVKPNSLLHILRTKIHLWPKAQKLPGDNKPLRPPGAFKKKSELSVKDGHVVLIEYCEERPLLLSNIGMGVRLCTYYQKLGPADQTAVSIRNGNTGLGNIVALDPSDKSPFLGEISPGCTQSSIETNMYRAPIFPHETSSTDYLLVRSAKGMLSLRRIDKIFASGQQEPHLEVMAPGTKNVQNYIWNRLLVSVYREFRAKEKSGCNPPIRADELSSKFPSIAEPFLRKRLKHCAELEKGHGEQLFYTMKPSFRIPSEDELRRMVAPENVCAYESMQAGLHRLKSLGIRSLTLPVGLAVAMSRLPDEAIALAAASHIERELQITPWNLSSNFVACTNLDRENIERLEITGVGDPSGRGLGFSYVRVAPKTGTSTSAKKKIASNRGGSTVTGTDADLRRLSMDAAREVLLKFDVPEENIGKMTRWHRIAMIRKLSSEQAASGIMVDTEALSKFARGQRMSFVQLQQQVREKCQEIWDRQVQSLSAVEGDENDTESEANSDLDSFAGDLENLLDAEEFEEVDGGDVSSKCDKVDGVKGLKMRRCPSQAQTEEQIEEEMEVAEIRWLLDADKSASQRKKAHSVNQNREGSVIVEARKPFNNTGQAASMSKVDLICSFKGNTEQDTHEVVASVVESLSVKAKAKKPNGKGVELLSIDSKKNIKPVKDGGKIVKEQKAIRDKFVCGACGMGGHMRTNKQCPKYGGDLETPESENVPGKSQLLDGTSGVQAKSTSKKLASKNVVRTSSDATGNTEISGHKFKARVPSLKVKCGPPDKHPENTNTPQISVKHVGGITSDDLETEPKSNVKINKIVISNKSRPEAIKSETPKPTVLIRVPKEIEKDKPHKRVIIKKPKIAVDLENVSHGRDVIMEEEVRKTKKIADLAGFEYYGLQQSQWISDDMMMREDTESGRVHEEEEARRSNLRIAEERRRTHEERITELEWKNFKESTIRMDLDEKPKTKKKKKIKPHSRKEYMEEYTSRGEKWMLERDRATKRRSMIDFGRHATDYGPPTKRRKGGEVLLNNILETIVDKLRDNKTVSYLFQKPVTKKDAPDYFEIIDRPMDLSTIKDKVRRIEYKDRVEFRHDVCQINFNAHKYNDSRYPSIPPLADQLLEFCDYLLDTNHELLSVAESKIEPRYL